MSSAGVDRPPLSRSSENTYSPVRRRPPQAMRVVCISNPQASHHHRRHVVRSASCSCRGIHVGCPSSTNRLAPVKKRVHASTRTGMAGYDG